MSEFLRKLKESQSTGQEKPTPEIEATYFARTNVGTRVASLKNSPNLLGLAEEVARYSLDACHLGCGPELEELRQFKLAKIEEFLKELEPPKFEIPPGKRLCVVGIVSGIAVQRRRANGANYAHLTLCDLRYEIDLFVIGNRLEPLLALKPGAVIAVASPTTSVSRSKSAKLPVSLSVPHNSKSIMLIGDSSHFGRCTQLQGKRRCPNWIDNRKSKMCGYHLEQQTFVAMGHRPEFNSTVTKLYEPRSNGNTYAIVKGGRVKWLNGLQPDLQKVAVENKPAVQSNPSSWLKISTEDEIVTPRKERERLTKRRQDQLLAERRIRAKLANRADGFMLKEYDQLGKPVEDESSDDGLVII